MRRPQPPPSVTRKVGPTYSHKVFPSIQTRTDRRRVPDAGLRATAGPQQRLVGCWRTPANTRVLCQGREGELSRSHGLRASFPYRTEAALERFCHFFTEVCDKACSLFVCLCAVPLSVKCAESEFSQHNSSSFEQFLSFFSLTTFYFWGCTL